MNRKAAIIIISICLALMIGGFMYMRSQAFMVSTAAVLADEATTALATKVNVGAVRIETLNAISMADVEVYDKKGELLLASERVTLRFSPWDMVSGADPVASIGHIGLERPRLNLQRKADGQWNYQELLSDDASGDMEFKGIVDVSGGTVSVDDATGKTVVTDINGELDCGAMPALAFEFAAMHDGAAVQLSGSWGGINNAVSIVARDVAVESYLQYLPKDMVVNFKQGTLSSLNATIVQDDTVDSGYKLDGEALLLDVAMDIGGALLSDVDGLILFNERGARVFSRGAVNEQPVVLRGTVRLDAAEPILDMQINSTGFDASKVMEKFPLSGEIAVAATVTGRFSNPFIMGNFKIAEATFNEYSIRDLDADLAFHDGVLQIDKATASMFGGSVALNGQVNAQTEEYSLTVAASELDIAPLTGYAAAGTLYSNITMSGQGLTLTDSNVYGTAVVHDGRYQAAPFAKAEMGFYYNHGNAVADYVNIETLDGRISGDGTLTDGVIRARLSGGIDLAAAAALVEGAEAAGRADFTARLSGTLDNPAVAVDFAAADGQLQYQPFEKLTGSAVLADNVLTADDIMMVNGRTEHSGKIRVGLTGERSLDVALVTRNARAEDIMRAAMAESGLTGNVDNAIFITGTVDDPHISGDIHFYDGSFRGILLRDSGGKYYYGQDKIQLENFNLSSPNLNVVVNGDVTADGNLNMAINAEQVDIGKLRLNLPYEVLGQVSFVGRLSGSVEEPEFSGELDAPELIFNKRKLHDIKGQVDYDHNVIELRSLGFKLDEGLVELSAGSNLQSQQIFGRLNVKHVDLAAILALVNVDSSWLSGALDGQIILGGTVSRPQVSLRGATRDAYLKNYPLNRVVMDVKLADNVITINKFEAEQNEGRLAAIGYADLDGEINVEFSGQNISAGILTSLADVNVETQGELNFAVQLGGTVQSPQANLSIDVAQGSIAGTTFDTLFGLVNLNDGIISFEQLLIQKGSYKASAYGILPWAAINYDPQRQASVKDQMDIKVSLDHADLSILPFITKEVKWALGATKGQVNITGTLAQPRFDGRVTINDGAIKFASLNRPVENMQFDLLLTGSELELVDFSGAMGAGSYKMSGSGKINGSGLYDYNFGLKLDKLGLESDFYIGPLQGEFTLNEAKLFNDRIVPQLIGTLHLENCIVDIPSVPDSDSEMPNIKLDIDVNVGNKVRLYNPYLYDLLLEGEAKFAGTTRHPRTSGEIEAVRGTVSYLKTQFKVREARATFNQVGSFLPSLDVEADTRLSRTKVYLKISGPVEEMQLKLTSDPAMNESDILSLLTLRSRFEQKSSGNDLDRDQMAALLDVGLQMSVMSELEGVLRKSLGVDEFRVVRDTLSLRGENAGASDREVFNIQIGKYVNDNLMLRYSTGIDHSQYKFGVQYDFNSRISLVGDVDEDGDTSIGIEARFKF